MTGRLNDIDSAGADTARLPRGLSCRALIRACVYMETHLGKALTLDDIAAAACISRSHFARRFRVSMGCTVMNYLYQLRIERAKALLSGAEPSLGELAAALGFAHQSHFTRVFRRHTGLCPSVYRRAHGEIRAMPAAHLLGSSPVLPAYEPGYRALTQEEHRRVKRGAAGASGAIDRQARFEVCGRGVECLNEQAALTTKESTNVRETQTGQAQRERPADAGQLRRGDDRPARPDAVRRGQS